MTWQDLLIKQLLQKIEKWPDPSTFPDLFSSAVHLSSARKKLERKYTCEELLSTLRDYEFLTKRKMKEIQKLF